MNRNRIIVTRESGEVAYEATVRLVHPASKATHFDPAEPAEYEVDEVWRTVGDGPEVKLRPEFIPDDVTDEILLLASNPHYWGPIDDREYDEDRWKEEHP
jgi:hypothetical protein